MRTYCLRQCSSSAHHDLWQKRTYDGYYTHDAFLVGDTHCLWWHLAWFAEYRGQYDGACATLVVCDYHNTQMDPANDTLHCLSVSVSLGKQSHLAIEVI